MKTKTLPLITSFFLLASCGAPAAPEKTSFGLQPFPTYGLYSDAPELITRGRVEYNLSDFDGLNGGTITSEYFVLPAEDGVLSFSLPFASSVVNIPETAVYVNGEPVEGEFRYGGFPSFSDEQSDIKNAVAEAASQTLDDSAMGTLYMFRPESDVLTVGTQLGERQTLIYHMENSFQGESSGWYQNMTLHNLIPGEEYPFFVTNGDFPEPPVTEAAYTKETLSCKEYVDRFYLTYKEYYDYLGGIPVGFFYAQLNALLNGRDYKTFKEIFFDSVSAYRLNVFDFKVEAKKAEPFTIRYKTKARIGSSAEYTPRIYAFRYDRLDDYPIDYSVRLPKAIAFCAESNPGMAKENLTYTATGATEQLYFVFSSADPAKQTISGPRRY